MENLACMSINKSPHDVVGVSREAKIVSARNWNIGSHSRGSDKNGKQ